jgi:cytochrome bd-type quinol oxidase subunit 2
MPWWSNPRYEAQKRTVENLASHGRELNQKYWIALLLYVVLAVLAWFTVGEGKIVVFGKPVELRLIPVLILALFALRTMLVHQADKIRHGGE